MPIVLPKRCVGWPGRSRNPKVCFWQLGGPCCGCPCNESPTIWGAMLGPPEFWKLTNWSVSQQDSPEFRVAKLRPQLRSGTMSRGRTPSPCPSEGEKARAEASIGELGRPDGLGK